MSSTPATLRPTRADVVLALLLAALLTGRAWATGGLCAAPGGEVYGHAWVQWWTSLGWPAWPTGTDLAVGTRAWPVIDPLPTWLLGGLARVVGPAVAWNTGATVAVVVAALGGSALARSVGGVPAVGAIGVAMAPIWLGSLTSGLTEDYAVGGVAYALAAARAGRWKAAGAVAGGLAWCGLYLAWFAGLGLAVLAVRRWRAWRSIGAGAGVAVALAAPAGWAFHARLGHAPAPVQAHEEPLWRVNPWHGADLASFGAPGKVDVGDAVVRQHPAYLGWAAVGLAGAGADPAGVLGVLAAAAVAVGPTPSWEGHPLGLDNPVLRVFELVPLAPNLRHHARFLLLGNLALVGMASRGARRFPRFAPALMAAETAWASPANVPLPVTPAGSPAVYAALAELPDAPVVVLGEPNPQRPLYDQRAHGRRLRLDPNRPGGLAVRPQDLVVGFGDAEPPGRGAPALEVDGARVWLPVVSPAPR